MVRAFSQAPLPPGLLDELIDLSRRAPSAGNTQAVGFTVLDKPAAIARYWAITLPPSRRGGFRWQQLLDAPALVLVTTRPSDYTDRYRESDKAPVGLGGSLEDWPVPYWWVDAGAAVQNLLLLAVDKELGACLFGPFDDEAAVSDEFSIEDGRRIVATVALGFPLADEPGRSARRARKPLDEVLDRPD